MDGTGEDTVFGGIRQGPCDLTHTWKEVQTVEGREEEQGSRH